MNKKRAPFVPLRANLILLLCGLGLVLALPLAAQDEGTTAEAEPEAKRSPEAIAILKRADAAIKAVTAVRYEATSTPTGMATNFLSAATGGGVMIGWNGSTPEKFYADIKTTKPGSDEPMVLTGGGDGDTYFLIDHTTKKAYEDMDPLVMGAGGRALGGLGMAEFVHPTPFDDELNADAVELQGTEKVGDEECYKIHVTYAGGAGASTWYFSTGDLLPRQRVRHFTTPQGDGTLKITLSELEVDPEIDPAMFKLKLPEGYEQIDDFAP